MNKLELYRQRLGVNPRFQPTTISNYYAAIRTLIKEYGENPMIGEINAFIKNKCDKRQPWAKYALREYLYMVGRESDYLKLVQAKIKKPVKPKMFLTKEKLLEVINNIKKEPYHTIGMLQMATAARAAGIIRLERKKIRQDVTRIRMTLREKGEKPTIVFLRLDFWKLIEPYYNKGHKYIFMEREAESYGEQQLNTRIITIYKRYLERLQEAARGLSINMSTHDIRRSIANNIQIATNDIRITSGVLDHSSYEVTENYLKDKSEQVATALLEQQKGLL